MNDKFVNTSKTHTHTHTHNLMIPQWGKKNQNYDIPVEHVIDSQAKNFTGMPTHQCGTLYAKFKNVEKL